MQESQATSLPSKSEDTNKNVPKIIIVGAQAHHEEYIYKTLRSMDSNDVVILTDGFHELSRKIKVEEVQKQLDAGNLPSIKKQFELQSAKMYKMDEQRENLEFEIKKRPPVKHRNKALESKRKKKQPKGYKKPKRRK